MSDPYRLPATAVPRRYQLQLQPRMEQGTFTGSVAIELDILEPVSELLLNARELTIDAVEVLAAGQSQQVDGWQLQPDVERLSIRLPAALPTGPAELRIVFGGVLNDKLAGFYRSHYADADGKQHLLAVTQFESTDARRAFPCFDEPALRAVFEVELLVPNDLLAVSNSPPLTEQPLDNGLRRIQFEPTIAMSSYLLAFVVGKLDRSAVVDVDGVAVSVVHLPGKAHLVGYALEVAAFALRYFNEYYDIPYPAKKLDLVAIPDFAAGAMENFACITFRETLVLVDRERATGPELMRVADVIVHEIAHMWFGDLVTMRWWNGLWLNEAFATFMAALCTDALDPEWQRWDQFALDRSAAFDADALRGTRPIEFPVSAPAEAEDMFDVLTYEKGASVLRMLEQFVGADRFRDGVRQYLRQHQYGNTETEDLWLALEAAVAPAPSATRQAGSGTPPAVRSSTPRSPAERSAPIPPVRQMMEGWIFQGGFPLIAVVASGSGVHISQRQFHYQLDRELRPPSSSGEAVEDGTGQAGGMGSAAWLVPVGWRRLAGSDGDSDGDSGERGMVLLAGPDAEIADATPPLVINADSAGFFRVAYEPSLLQQLAGARHLLRSAERYALVDDTWAAVLAGATAASDYLALAAAWTGEDSLDVWKALLAPFDLLLRIVLQAPGAAHAALQGLVRRMVAPALDALGAEPRDGDDARRRELRGLLTRALAIAGADLPTRKRCRDLHDSYLAADTGGSVAMRGGRQRHDADLVAAAAAVVADGGDARDHEAFLQRYTNAPTPQERQRYLRLLAAFPGAAQIDQTLELTLTDRVRTQDAPYLFGACLGNRRHGGRAWEFAKQHWDGMLERWPDASFARMMFGVRALAEPETAADVLGWCEAHPLRVGQRLLARSLERLSVNVALRRREQQRLPAALAESDRG